MTGPTASVASTSPSGSGSPVLFDLWTHVTSLARDGLTAASGVREIRMSVDQWLALNEFLTNSEQIALGVFFRDMKVYRDEAGERFFVEGFTRDYLSKATSLTSYAARTALAGLSEKEILREEKSPLAGNGQWAPAWRSLVGAWFGRHTTTGERHQASRASRSGKAPRPGEGAAMGVVATPMADDATGAAVTAETTATAQAMIVPGAATTFEHGRSSSGRISAGGEMAVDNSSGGFSTGGDPTCGQLPPKGTNVQVRPSGRFSAGRFSAATRKEGSRKFSNCPSPTDKPRTAAVAAFARDPQMLDLIDAHGVEFLAGLRQNLGSPTHVERASAVLAFFDVVGEVDPVTEALDLAVQFLGATGPDAAAHATSLREHFAASTTHHPKGISEDDLLTGTALAIVSALDVAEPIKSFPSWFAKLLKHDHQWRQVDSVAATMRGLSALAARPAGMPVAATIASLDDPTYMARLDSAREVIWSEYADARDDVSWNIVVNTPSRHPRVFQVEEEILTGVRKAKPAPANWREIASA